MRKAKWIIAGAAAVIILGIAIYYVIKIQASAARDRRSPFSPYYASAGSSNVCQNKRVGSLSRVSLPLADDPIWDALYDSQLTRWDALYDSQLTRLIGKPAVAYEAVLSDGAKLMILIISPGTQTPDRDFWMGARQGDRVVGAYVLAYYRGGAGVAYNKNISISLGNLIYASNYRILGFGNEVYPNSRAKKWREQQKAKTSPPESGSFLQMVQGGSVYCSAKVGRPMSANICYAYDMKIDPGTYLVKGSALDTKFDLTVKDSSGRVLLCSPEAVSLGEIVAGG